MNLRNVDLNLLVVFDTLMRIRHVSRAAAHLGIGQPGMSAALGRLRRLFGDPLLVRQGNEMAPTDRALALQPEVIMLLREVAKVIAPPQDFEPETSDRSFRLRMSDLLSVLLLPGLVGRFATTAPQIRCEILHLSPTATVDAMERDTVELAVSTDLDIPKSISIQHLFDDHVVCLARHDLAIERHLQDAEAFVELPQIRVSQSPIDDRFADRQLREKGLKRDVALTVPHWLAVPDILAASSLVVVIPASIAVKMSDRLTLKAYPLPFLNKGFKWSLYWHKRHETDPGHAWLRQAITDHCRRYHRDSDVVRLEAKRRGK